MSKETLSRSAPPTLADLIAQINRRADLQLRRRQDLTSALRRFCRVQGRDAREVSADPVTVRRQLSDMSAGSTGLAPGSLRNLRSLVGQALLLAGVTTLPRRSRVAVSPEWKALVTGVEDRHRRDRLNHLARHLSARGIHPTDVDDGLVERYRHQLISESLVTRPQQAARETVLAWNIAVGNFEGQPLRKLTVPSARRNYALRPESFPPSFLADLDRYLGQLKGDDLFGERTTYPASPDTISARRKWILGIASALVESGRDPESIRSLADLVERDAAKSALRAIWKRLEKRKTGYLHNLALLLVNIGRHWVKLPADQLEELRGLRRSLNPGKGGMTEANRRKLLQFADLANVRRLHQLPSRLMEEAIRRDRDGVEEAVLAQTAVAIAIELKAPLRIRTLVGLDLERHIVHSRPGPKGVVHLVIPPGLVKNREPLQFELPTSVVRLIDLYCTRFRPRLVTQPGSWLFPGRHGPKDRGGMSKQISQMIRKQTGLQMHTHLFRHLAGFLILREHPGEFETVRLLLGHRSLETTVRFYSGMEQAAAFRRYDEIVSKYGENRDAAD
jgi:integrase